MKALRTTNRVIYCLWALKAYDHVFYAVVTYPLSVLVVAMILKMDPEFFP